MYEEGGVYEYGDTVILFEDGNFYEFGWEVPMVPSDKDTQTSIDVSKIGALVMKLPINRGGGCHDHRVGAYGQDLTGELKFLSNPF
jgi:hypothetical protein